nr:hypothetical protein BaRGS_018540 [Batillaria attramentaria]
MGANQGNYTPQVYLDAANGVGAPKVTELAGRISKHLQLQIVNDGSQGKLNYRVAGYLQELVRGSGLSLNLGLVQTAYANGSSTKFITQTMTVGDAMSDMLLVEVILSHRGWSVADWDAMYTDLPNRQIKIKGNADQLAHRVGLAVYEKAGGVGDKPAAP